MYYYCPLNRNCMYFGHAGDENFLKRAGQEDILGSSPTASAVRIHTLKIPTQQVVIWGRSCPFFAGLVLSSVIFCMECPYCQYFPVKVDFWNDWPVLHHRATSILTFLKNHVRSSFCCFVQSAATRFCIFIQPPVRVSQQALMITTTTRNDSGFPCN